MSVCVRRERGICAYKWMGACVGVVCVCVMTRFHYSSQRLHVFTRSSPQTDDTQWLPNHHLIHSTLNHLHPRVCQIYPTECPHTAINWFQKRMINF